MPTPEISILEQLRKYYAQLQKQPGPTVSDVTDNFAKWVLPQSPAEAAFMATQLPVSVPSRVALGGLSALLRSPDVYDNPPPDLVAERKKARAEYYANR